MTALPQPRPMPPRGVTRTLIVCALIAAAAMTTAALLPGYVRDETHRSAESTLRSFLDDAAGGDPGWREAASPLLLDLVPVGTPLRGEEKTAASLGLVVAYRLGPLTLLGDSVETSDTASADIDVEYRYRILGKSGTASAPQTVWLTRPFYYGDDEPRRADPARTPTAIGPWRVAGISLPTADGDARRGDAPLRSAFELESDERAADAVHCYSPAKALAQLSDGARIDGALASSCFLGAEDGSDAIDAQIDVRAFVESVPAIDDADAASMPPELLRLDADVFHGLRTPFTQYLIDDSYVLTFAAVSTGENQTATRLVSIRPADAAR